MQPLKAVVTALLLLRVSGLNAPENVIVKCENLRTTVQWNYSDQQPNTTFIVKLKGSVLSHEVQTAGREYDLSQFIWRNEEQYMDFHYVTVTASQGSNLSETAKSKTFSFNQLKSADIKCELDFPPVNLTVKESEATVSFVNPFHFYQELKQSNKPSSAVFSFSISSKNSDHDIKCKANQRACKHSFVFPEDAEPCVKLRGRIFEGNSVGQIEFKETDPICPTISTGDHWLLAVLILIIASIVIACLTAAICKLRAWTMKTPPLPDPLVPNLQDRPNPRSFFEPMPVFSPIQITGYRAPPVDPEEDSPIVDSQDDPGQEPETVALIFPEPQDEENESADSIKTESVSLHSSSSETELPIYETRPRFVNMDLGDGEMVTTYTMS